MGHVSIVPALPEWLSWKWLLQRQATSEIPKVKVCTLIYLHFMSWGGGVNNNDNRRLIYLNTQSPGSRRDSLKGLEGLGSVPLLEGVCH